MDDSDLEGDEKEASHHGSLRNGSNFSSRSIRMNTHGAGQGQLNDAFPPPPLNLEPLAVDAQIMIVHLNHPDAIQTALVVIRGKN